MLMLSLASLGIDRSESSIRAFQLRQVVLNPNFYDYNDCSIVDFFLPNEGLVKQQFA